MIALLTTHLPLTAALEEKAGCGALLPSNTSALKYFISVFTPGVKLEVRDHLKQFEKPRSIKGRHRKDG